MASTNCNGLTLRSNTTVPLSNPQMDNNFSILCDKSTNALNLANTLVSQLQYGSSGTSSTKFTGDQFTTLRTNFNTLQSDFNILNTKNGIVTKLGFTPVQQGGISGYGDNNVIIGWSNASTGSTVGKLLVQVDVNNFAENWPINSASTSSVNWTNVQNRPTNISSFSNDLGYLTKNDVGFEYMSWTDNVNLVVGTVFNDWANIKTWTITVPTNKTLALINSTTYVHVSKEGSTAHTKTIEFRILANGNAIGHGYIRPDPNTDNDLTWCIPIQGVVNISTSTLNLAIQGRVSNHQGSVKTNIGEFGSGKGPVLSEVKIIWM